MIRIMTIFGTRPEAIKMAPVVRMLQEHNKEFECKVCVTAQHRQMLDQVLNLFSIKPDYDLNIMKANQTLPELTANILQGISQVFARDKPDMILVQGDTTTCFAAALAAFYEKIAIGHIEAGLRTYKKHAPFPEEINRVLTTQLSSLHFAPTETSKQNLLTEHIPAEQIIVTGNTVIDALFWVRDKVRQKTDWGNIFGSAQQVVESGQKFILVTGHRRENFGDGFQNICQALAKIAQLNPDWHIIYPVHLNPNVQQPVKTILGNLNNVHLLAPLDYEPFVYLMDKSYLILTDSGGVQEEAPSLGKPVLVMREVTERPEAVAVGTVLLVGTDVDRIVQQAQLLMTDKDRYCKMTSIANPYGDGHSAAKIVTALKDFFLTK